MTDEDFLRHLDEYGASPERWPPELRAAADDALARSSALRTALENAQSFDRLLAVPAPPVEDARVDRLLAAVGKAARGMPQDSIVMLLLGRMPRRTVAGFCAVLLMLGWLTGQLASPAPTAPRGQELALLSDEVVTLFDGDSR
ncbi:hypothetical protein M5E06_28210 [Azospirillum sp. A1-3]|uniref:hypothetical protein n=1 Tax=Azospirillum sp. A1-3 TaxID=185874 RepID=UPI0020771F38|nr:hypothetical protein [Azospirillum sp. A1-3]MCM8738013.1 hypothetical protein [Azospirillum sp. A1-3]